MEWMEPTWPNYGLRIEDCGLPIGGARCVVRIANRGLRINRWPWSLRPSTRQGPVPNWQSAIRDPQSHSPNPQTAIRHPQSSVLDEVAEVLQFDGEVDVIDHDLLGHLQNDRREVEDTGDAAADQPVGHLLRCRGGHGDNGHA